MQNIPIGISGRHVHLTREALDTLFGVGYELTVFKMLSQPGQFACNEKVTIISPAGVRITDVRILGPLRKSNQIEISQSDAIRNKFIAPVRSSGDVANSGACVLEGPVGQFECKEGVIIADRHIHFQTLEASKFGVKDGDKVSIKVDGIKPGLLSNVLCRVNDAFALDCHLDTDDGAAFMLKTGDTCILVKKFEILE
jgi:putative phosphotransacetylase